MGKHKTIEQKYYFIMKESMTELLDAVNACNSRAYNVYKKETFIFQIIEPITSPNEYIAVCYDVDLPKPPEKRIGPM